MHLDIGNAIFQNLIVHKLLGYHGRIHQAFPDSHGKQVVRIPAKGFAVEEIPPPADHLSRNQTQDAAVSHGEKGQLSFLRKYDESQGRRNDTPVNSQSTCPEVKYLQQIILIICPVENNIVGSVRCV